ncbi:hypothetical protein [Paraburkholderia sp. GAS42]|uniref:hypothetical protein n=1 Tax=Paraburkholderia sp. GAS42 TaxID=3035135 RepID=UPI003D1B3423
MPDGALVQQAVRDAFTLGWSLVELQGRVCVELGEAEQRGMRVASLWRVSLYKISSLQQRVFQTSTTAQTVYEPEKDIPKYLYPADGSDDYTKFGILPGTNTEQDMLPDFKLYDVTRRAINCLSLLYVSPEESLNPGRISQLQGELARRVKDEAVQGTSSPAVQAPEQPPGEDASTAADKPDQSYAKSQLTTLLGKFLNAWDGYLREQYYVGGMIPNNGLELVAYEAGRSMASLSWNVTIGTLEQEREDQRALCARQATGTVPATPAAPPQAPQRDDAKENAVRTAWASAFRPEFIIRLQHDVVALSAALDAAYHDAHSGTPPAAGSSAPVGRDPDLPSESICAVKQSIEFWRRAVENELSATYPEQRDRYQDSAGWSRPLRIALTKQVNIWQTLLTGQQSLRAFSTESVAQSLMESVWNDVQSGIANDFTQSLKQARGSLANLAREAGDAIEVVFKQATFLLWPIGVIAAVVSIGFVVVAFTGPPEALKAAAGALGITGLGSSVASFFRNAQLRETKDQQKKRVLDPALESTKGGADGETQGGLANQIGNTAHSLADDVVNAFNKGLEQIQVELEGLNRSVGVSYPLVDYFAMKSISGQTTVDFLTKIVWTGDERIREMKAVMRAALGPLALFATASSTASPHADAGSGDVGSAAGKGGRNVTKRTDEAGGAVATTSP